MGVSAWGQVGSASVIFMSTVELEGVGERTFTELADNMMMQGVLLTWPMFSLWFYMCFHYEGTSDDTS